MKCKEHPRYAAMRMPTKTVRYPDGCPSCWGIWDAAKVDLKRRLRTVNVEMSIEDARRAVIALDTLINHRPADVSPERIQKGGQTTWTSPPRAVVVSPGLQSLYAALAQAVREAL